MTRLQFDATPDELRVLIAENDEILQALDGHLILLEREGASPALLQNMFRAAHTVKGSSAAIGHTRMATLTHAVETLMDRLRRGESEVSPTLVDHLFGAIDVMKLLATEVDSGDPVEVDVDAHVRVLEAWANSEGKAVTDVVSILASAIPRPETATHHVLLQFEAGPWVAVRALQSLIGLSAIAEVIESQPTRAEVEAEQVHERLEAWLRTERSEADIRGALADIPETHILTLMDAEAATEAHAVQAQNGNPRPGRSAGATTDSANDADPPAATRGNAGSRSTSTTVRIDVERLDQLVNLVGELVIDRTRLMELGRGLADQVGDNRLLRDLNETTLHLGRVTDELQSEVMKSRMLPISTVFGRIPRLVRDLALRQGKQVDLLVTGQDTELDRSVIEEIGDPLIHLLRNAVDHGVESTERRLEMGKPATATIRLTAEHAENSIVVRIEDDGAGIDGEKVRAKAVERGLLSEEVASRLTPAEAVELVFLPGLSTASELTDVSGRGVGMDIVRTNVERLGGSVTVQTEVGHGTRFVMRLPLTLAILQSLLVRVQGGVYALPLTSVTETMRVRREEVQRLHGQEAIVLRGNVLPVVRLANVFGRPAASLSPDQSTLDTGLTDAARTRSEAYAWVVAVRVGDRQIGLAVDALLGEQEVVIKGLGSLIGVVPGISSAAILGDGTVALITDVPSLVQYIAEERREGKSHASRSSELVSSHRA